MVGYGYYLRLARQAGWPLRARKEGLNTAVSAGIWKILSDLRLLLRSEMEVKTGTQ